MKYKSKISFFLIAILIIISFLGAGFSFWTFNKDQRYDNEFSVYITESSLAGSFATPGMPVYAVLDEGLKNVNSTITGISFYKGGKKTINGITFFEERLIDSDLTLTFTTNQPLSYEEVDQLSFGLRVRTTGKLSTYLRKTSFYSQMQLQDKAPNDKNGNYIDLKALTQKTNYDGTTNYSCIKRSDNRWVMTFRFSTIMLDSFYTYWDGKCPDTQEKYQQMIRDLKENSISTFLLELWQGW